MALYKKIVDEVVQIPQVDKLVLHGLGEPTLDPHLEERLAYARARSNIAMEIYTHGAHLGPDRFEALKKAGLTSLVFSLNAVRPEQHEAIMGLKGKFDTVVDNIEYAIAHRGSVGIEVHAVSNDDQFTEDDRIVFYQKWGSVFEGGVGNCIRELNWAGDNRSTFKWDPNVCCQRAVGQIYVMYDGRVTMCCLDPTGKTIFGDLNKQTIKEVYNSDYYTMFRSLHSTDKAAVFKACKNCTRS